MAILEFRDIVERETVAFVEKLDRKNSSRSVSGTHGRLISARLSGRSASSAVDRSQLSVRSAGSTAEAGAIEFDPAAEEKFQALSRELVDSALLRLQDKALSLGLAEAAAATDAEVAEQARVGREQTAAEHAEVAANREMQRHLLLDTLRQAKERERLLQAETFFIGDDSVIDRDASHAIAESYDQQMHDTSEMSPATGRTAQQHRGDEVARLQASRERQSQLNSRKAELDNIEANQRSNRGKVDEMEALLRGNGSQMTDVSDPRSAALMTGALNLRDVQISRMRRYGYSGGS